jgi:hypothetical protein
MKKIWFLILFICIGLISKSQTTLTAGDILIVGMNCDDPDEFACVPLIDLELGTVIRFTDDGWLSVGGFRVGEGGVEYIASSTITSGTVITFTAPASGDWAVNNTGLGTGNFLLSTSGDQIIAFQGVASTPTILYVVNNAGAGVWQTDASNSNTSALPTGLTNGLNAVALNELDNYVYSGGPYSDPSILRSMVGNNSNWTGDNAVRQSMPSSPLPVELSSFSAIVLENAIKLNWRTETEVSNYGFEIQRAEGNFEFRNSPEGMDPQNFEMIGFVEGHGNSNSPKEYSFTDDLTLTPNLTHTLYYRLKQIDTDGKFEYSKVIEVDLGSPKKFELSQNYPNPFNPTTTISFSLPQSGNVKLTVYNLLGEQVAELVNGFKEAGIHTINFNAENFNSGLYIYKIEANGIVQSKKMTLVK